MLIMISVMFKHDWLGDGGGVIDVLGLGGVRANLSYVGFYIHYWYLRSEVILAMLLMVANSALQKYIDVLCSQLLCVEIFLLMIKHRNFCFLNFFNL